MLDAKAELQRELALIEMPAVAHLELREHMGMFEYRQEDEQLLVKNLILGNIQSSIVVNCRLAYHRPAISLKLAR